MKLVGVPSKEEFARNVQSDKNPTQEVHVEIVLLDIVPPSVAFAWHVQLVNLPTLVEFV